MDEVKEAVEENGDAQAEGEKPEGEESKEEASEQLAFSCYTILTSLWLEDEQTIWFTQALTLFNRRCFHFLPSLNFHLKARRSGTRGEKRDAGRGRADYNKSCD